VNLIVPGCIKRSPDIFLEGPSIKSEAAFPLKIGDEVFGVLNIESEELNGFDEEDLKVLSSFASQMSISIENAQLFSDLKTNSPGIEIGTGSDRPIREIEAMGEEMAAEVAHDFNNVLAVVLSTNCSTPSHQLERLNPEEIP